MCVCEGNMYGACVDAGRSIRCLGGGVKGNCEPLDVDPGN